MAVFSLLNITLQIYLNGQPVLTHEYIGENRENGYNGFREKRHKHTDGEVTCVSTEQYVSLPSMAVIGKFIDNSEKTLSSFFYHIQEINIRNMLKFF